MKELLAYGQDFKGNYVPLRTDLSGRALNGYYFRDALATGCGGLTRALETTLIEGIVDINLDLIHVSCSNSSTVAQQIDIRSGTAGAVLERIWVPAQNTVHLYYNGTPLPAMCKDTKWTAQNTTGGEISDSPVYVSLIAFKNPD